jgi:hypothetical protein
MGQQLIQHQAMQQAIAYLDPATSALIVGKPRAV